MISRPPTIRINQNMGGCLLLTMLLPNLLLLVDVTFSTPTGDYANNPMAGDGGGVVNHPCNRSFA